MKIGNAQEKPVVAGPAAEAAEGAKARSATSASSAQPAAGDASAHVALSSTAASLLSSSGTADFDAAKVQRIAEAIANGTFKVDPEAIADKLIGNARELLNNVR